VRPEDHSVWFEIMDTSRVRSAVVLTLLFMGGLLVLVAETKCGSVFAPDLTLALDATPRGQFIVDCHNQLAWRQAIGWVSLVAAGIVAIQMRRRRSDPLAEAEPRTSDVSANRMGG